MGLSHFGIYTDCLKVKLYRPLQVARERMGDAEMGVRLSKFWVQFHCFLVFCNRLAVLALPYISLAQIIMGFSHIRRYPRQVLPYLQV